MMYLTNVFLQGRDVSGSFIPATKEEKGELNFPKPSEGRNPFAQMEEGRTR
jgi:hypothetical protein